MEMAIGFNQMRNIYQLKTWEVIIFIIITSAIFTYIDTPIYQLVYFIPTYWGRIICEFVLGGVLIGLYLLLASTIETGHVTLGHVSISYIFRNLSIGILIGIICICSIILSLMVFKCYTIERFSFPGMSLLLSLAFYFIGACCEEIVFRGIILRFIGIKWNTVAALVISSVLFGLIHIFNSGMTWMGIVGITLVGFMLGASYLYSGSIWMPLGIHWIWNVLEDSVFGSAVSGSSADTSMIQAQFQGSDLMIGGSCGIEASVVTMVLATIITIYFLLYSREELKSIKTKYK